MTPIDLVVIGSKVKVIEAFSPLTCLTMLWSTFFMFGKKLMTSR
jgi:hypothetical protein